MRIAMVGHKRVPSREGGIEVVVEELAARMQKPSAAPQAKASGGLTVDYAAEISKELSALLGRKVQLTDGKKTGKIELEFYGSDDREALIDQLKSLKK